MMRAPEAWAVAARRPDGIIEAQRNELPRLSSRNKLATVPFVRGVFVLIESLQLGFSALSWSAQRAGEEDEQVGRAEVIFTMVIAIVGALLLFVLGPAFIANWLKNFLGGTGVAFVIIDGLLRIGMIVG